MDTKITETETYMAKQHGCYRKINKGYVAAKPDDRNGPRIGLLKSSGKCRLPESKSIK